MTGRGTVGALRFSLLSLLLALLFLASATTLILRWGPWLKIATIQLGMPDSSFLYSRIFFVLNQSRLFITNPSDSGAQLRDATSGELLHTLDCGRTMQTSFSADTTRALNVSAGRPSELSLWDLQSGREITLAKQSRDHSSFAACLSADGRHYAVGTQEGHVWLYDVASSQRTEFKAPFTALYNVTFSRDGRRLAATGSQEAVVWDIASKKILLQATHSSDEADCFLSPTGDRLLLSSPGNACLWDVDNRMSLRCVNSSVHDSTATLFSGGTSRLYTGGRRIVSWDAATGRDANPVVDVFSDIALIPPVPSPDSRRILCFDAQGRVRLYDSTRGTLVAELEPPNNNRYRGAHSLTSTHAATSDSGSDVNIWNSENGLHLAQLRHNWEVNRILLDSQGERCVTITIDRSLHIWKRNRPESLWGIALMPEFWTTLVLFSIFIWNVTRMRSLRRT